MLNSDELYRHPNKGIKHGNSIELMACDENYSKDNFFNGKVIGEFICDRIDEIERDMNDWLPKSRYDLNDKQLSETCLTEKELWEYGKGQLLYGLHISDLKIYEEPKELGEFRRPCDKFLDCITCKRKNRDEIGSCDNRLTRPPQSWEYVEEI